LAQSARYMLELPWKPYGVRFPYGTFVIKCERGIADWIHSNHTSRTTASQYWRYLIPMGFIGAYTTFSTFEYETLRAVQDGQVITGLLNVALSVIVGFAAVWAGAVIGRGVRMKNLKLIFLRKHLYSGHWLGGVWPQFATLMPRFFQKHGNLRLRTAPRQPAFATFMPGHWQVSSPAVEAVPTSGPCSETGSQICY